MKRIIDKLLCSLFLWISVQYCQTFFKIQFFFDELLKHYTKCNQFYNLLLSILKYPCSLCVLESNKIGGKYNNDKKDRFVVLSMRCCRLLFNLLSAEQFCGNGKIHIFCFDFSYFLSIYYLSLENEMAISM